MENKSVIKLYTHGFIFDSQPVIFCSCEMNWVGLGEVNLPQARDALNLLCPAGSIDEFNEGDADSPNSLCMN